MRTHAAALAALTAMALAASPAASAAAHVDTVVNTSEDTYYSGSCSGELVLFTGSYHEVVHIRYDGDGHLLEFNVMTGESNYGVGVGQTTGNRYVRVYRQNSPVQYEFDPYTQSATGTYLTQVLHLGPDGELVDDDLWIRSVIRIVDTPEGWVFYHEHTSANCY